jgi:hypothetical protein
MCAPFPNISGLSATPILAASGEQLLMVLIQSLDKRQKWFIFVPRLKHCWQKRCKNKNTLVTVICDIGATRVQQRLEKNQCGASRCDNVMNQRRVREGSSDHGLPVDRMVDFVGAGDNSGCADQKAQNLRNTNTFCQDAK